MKRFHTRQQEQKGFTIVELLVATLVFSTVLLVVTIGIIRINRVYYRGLNETATQDTTRLVMESISQAIQFGGGDVTETGNGAPGDKQTFCVGNKQFTYITGRELVNGTPESGKHQANMALITRTMPGCVSTSPAASPGDGQELLGPKMRLSELSVKRASTTNDDLYKITVRIAFGDDDLLNDDTGTKPSCKTDTGSQFCAVSELTTTVVKRIGND